MSQEMLGLYADTIVPTPVVVLDHFCLAIELCRCSRLARKLNLRFEVVVQLKDAIRSILWQTHRKNAGELMNAESPAFLADRQLDEALDPV